MDTKPVTHRILELCTSHLQPSTLEHWLPAMKVDRPSAFIEYEYGWILNAHYLVDQLKEGEVALTADVEECCRYALDHGCNYLMLDCDAGRLAPLTDYFEAHA